jgi:ABC-type thiamine transport system substrate-binding protein
MIRIDRRTRVRLTAGLAAACVLALAACSSSSSTSASSATSASTSSSASSSSSAAAAAAAASKVTLVVYSAQGYDSAMTKAFTTATGIPVKLDDNSTGPLLTQIEASRNNPNWGLLWVDGATAFAGLDTQGLLLKGFEPSVSWNSLGTQSLPADKSYTPTGVTLMAALAYNKKKVTAPPTTWQQLLSSQWKGQVGMNDPSQSGPTFPFIAGMMNYLGGVSAGETYFTNLKANGLVSRPIMMAWLFTFCGVFLELPLSQLLYAPGSPPASIAIEDNLSNYHFGVGMAQAVLAVAIALAAVGVVLGGYRLLAPAGWRRIGSAIGGGRG